MEENDKKIELQESPDILIPALRSRLHFLVTEHSSSVLIFLEVSLFLYIERACSGERGASEEEGRRLKQTLGSVQSSVQGSGSLSWD